MKTTHPVESEVQQYALNERDCEITTVNHIQTCAHCQTRAATYRFLFQGLQNQPKPAFDFDLSALVVARIEQRQPPFSWLALFIYLLAFAPLVAIGVVGYLHRNYFFRMFAGLSTMGMYLIAITALLLLVFQSLEMYKKHQKRMSQLNFD